MDTFGLYILLVIGSDGVGLGIPRIYEDMYNGHVTRIRITRIGVSRCTFINSH